MNLYLFVFNSAKFGAFFALFGLFGAIFGAGVRLKNFLRPTCVYNQLSFWKYSPNISLFLIGPHLGPVLPFFDPASYFLFFWAIFGVGNQIEKHFWNLLM